MLGTAPKPILTIEADTIARDALAEAERQYGPDHPGTVSCVAELASLLYLKGDFASAEPLYRRALETHTRVLGPQHPDTVASANKLKWFLDHNKGNRTSGASSD